MPRDRLRHAELHGPDRTYRARDGCVIRHWRGDRNDTRRSWRGGGIAYHRNQKGAEATRDAIAKAGGRAIAVAADVRSAEAVRSLVDRVTAELGPIDVLVNNAGSLVMRRSILELTEPQLDEILALNLKSAVLAAQAVAAGDDRAKVAARSSTLCRSRDTREGAGAGRIRRVESGTDVLHQVSSQRSLRRMGSG